MQAQAITPVLALSQLSPQVESRDEYCHQMRKPLESNRETFAEWLAKGEKMHGKAEVIIGKQRHGPTGTVELQFKGAITKFSTLAREDRLPERI